MHHCQVERARPEGCGGPAQQPDELGHDPLDPGRVAFRVGTHKESTKQPLVVGAPEQAPPGRRGGCLWITRRERGVGQSSRHLRDPILHCRHEPFEDGPLGVPQPGKGSATHE